MIKYKCRPAIHTKLVCEYCESINFVLPNKYHHYKYLADTDLIGFKIITNLLNFIESNNENNYFFIDLLGYFNQRIIEFTKIDLSSDISIAQKLLAFTQFYNQVSDLNWHNVETDNSLALVAKRNTQSVASKYDDLFIYSSVINILHCRVNEKSNVIIELPFESAFYGVNVALFNKVTFNCQAFSVIVPKEEGEACSLTVATAASFSSLDRIRAAANSIPPSELSLASLANLIGVSERGLQRELKSHNICVKDMINKVRIDFIISILNKNNGNIKQSAYESGFKDLPSFSRYFSKITGISPTRYVKDNITINMQL
ncbi:AraC family transcriptional regulator [Shewanella sp. 6_MG-2023]|uniref:helix-turn-helix domain-containing protein n=1 Tax=Shewanella sp. 6_MG-2023 TaxID=3062660 RepID=UPI0026E18440|nr:helix-turn-helix transcriptional regulator [Shewanella sp. 6_MG-2023]MDO6620955.1 helix-turn-helix transcriptional regulator [Shewanella sp. 6_MG-2023]